MLAAAAALIGGTEGGPRANRAVRRHRRARSTPSRPARSN
jgi:hypothetical protein